MRTCCFQQCWIPYAIDLPGSLTEMTGEWLSLAVPVLLLQVDNMALREAQKVFSTCYSCWIFVIQICWLSCSLTRDKKAPQTRHCEKCAVAFFFLKGEFRTTVDGEKSFLSCTTAICTGRKAAPDATGKLGCFTTDAITKKLLMVNRSLCINLYFKDKH